MSLALRNKQTADPAGGQARADGNSRGTTRNTETLLTIEERRGAEGTATHDLYIYVYIYFLICSIDSLSNFLTTASVGIGFKGNRLDILVTPTPRLSWTFHQNSLSLFTREFGNIFSVMLTRLLLKQEKILILNSRNKWESDIVLFITMEKQWDLHQNGSIALWRIQFQTPRAGLSHLADTCGHWAREMWPVWAEMHCKRKTHTGVQKTY